jgi:hypothetical protein
VRDPWQRKKVPQPRFWLQQRLTFIKLFSVDPLIGVFQRGRFPEICGAFLAATVLVSSCECGDEDGNEHGGEDGNEAGGQGTGSLLATTPFSGSRFAPGFDGPWFSEPEVRAEDLPHALPVQAVPDGDLFERQALHGTQPEHLVLARLWRIAADWLDPDVQADRLDDQQSHLQGDCAVACF